MNPRSFLFAPGDHAKLLGKVLHAGADAVVLDLEDGVPPGGKVEARSQVRELIESRQGLGCDHGPQVWVRINALDAAQWREDVDAVVVRGLDGIRVPKAESLDLLVELDLALASAESRRGLESGSIGLACTIESAQGLVACRRFAEVPRVAQLAFGEADFIADIGASPVPVATLWARSQIVVESRAAGLLPPIAPVYTHLADDEGLRRTSEENRDLGFGGRSCIHPRQLAIVHEVFSPSAAEVSWAREVEAAGQSGRGKAGHQFVDEAVLRRARSVLERAARQEASVS